MGVKWKFRLLGLITLIGFPLPAIYALIRWEEKTVSEILAFSELSEGYWMLGIQFGLVYAAFVLLVTQLDIFEELSRQQMRMIRSLKLGWWDVLFISFAAGFGEEVLFRAGIQTWLGPWITSVLFVAIHGYLNPFSWRKSLHGLLVLPFIVLLAFSYEVYGLWFVIAAHAAYDFLLFSMMISEEENNARSTNDKFHSRSPSNK